MKKCLLLNLQYSEKKRNPKLQFREREYTSYAVSSRKLNSNDLFIYITLQLTSSLLLIYQSNKNKSVTCNKWSKPTMHP